MDDRSNPLKSIAIAQAVAACINAEGGVGEMGGRPASATSNTVRIYSQVCDVLYMFHGDGTVDLLDPEDAYDEIAEEMGYGEEDMLEEFGTVEDFASDHTGMEFERFMSIENGWFCGASVEEACIAFVKAIVASEM